MFVFFCLASLVFSTLVQAKTVTIHNDLDVCNHRTLEGQCTDFRVGTVAIHCPQCQPKQLLSNQKTIRLTFSGQANIYVRPEIQSLTYRCLVKQHRSQIKLSKLGYKMKAVCVRQ